MSMVQQGYVCVCVCRVCVCVCVCVCVSVSTGDSLEAMVGVELL